MNMYNSQGGQGRYQPMPMEFNPLRPGSPQPGGLGYGNTIIGGNQSPFIKPPNVPTNVPPPPPEFSGFPPPGGPGYGNDPYSQMSGAQKPARVYHNMMRAMMDAQRGPDSGAIRPPGMGPTGQPSGAGFPPPGGPGYGNDPYSQMSGAQKPARVYHNMMRAMMDAQRGPDSGAIRPPGY